MAWSTGIINNRVHSDKYTRTYTQTHIHPQTDTVRWTEPTVYRACVIVCVIDLLESVFVFLFFFIRVVLARELLRRQLVPALGWFHRHRRAIDQPKTNSAIQEKALPFVDSRLSCRYVIRCRSSPFHSPQTDEYLTSHCHLRPNWRFCVTIRVGC